MWPYWRWVYLVKRPFLVHKVIKLTNKKNFLQKWKMLAICDFYNKFSISDLKFHLKGVPDLLVPQDQFPGPGGLEVEFFWNFLFPRPFLWEFALPAGTWIVPASTLDILYQLTWDCNAALNSPYGQTIWFFLRQSYVGQYSLQALKWSLKPSNFINLDFLQNKYWHFGFGGNQGGVTGLQPTFERGGSGNATKCNQGEGGVKKGQNIATYYVHGPLLHFYTSPNVCWDFSFR